MYVAVAGQTSGDSMQVVLSCFVVSNDGRL